MEAYYRASSALSILPLLKKQTPILYAADDPLFDPTIVPDLQAAGSGNSDIDLVLTRYRGNVGYLSSNTCQRLFGDPDPWSAWNRVLEWCDRSQAGEQHLRERDEGEGKVLRNKF